MNGLICRCWENVKLDLLFTYILFSLLYRGITTVALILLPRSPDRSMEKALAYLSSGPGSKLRLSPNVFNRKRGSTVYSLSLTPNYRPVMTIFF